MKPRFEEKFPWRVLPSTPFGNIPQRFPALQGTAGHYIMPNSKGFQLPMPLSSSSSLCPLPPVATCRCQGKRKKKKSKNPKPCSSLKREHRPIKSPSEAGGNAMALAAGCAPQETSAAFPLEDTGSPAPTATYEGFPALTVTVEAGWRNGWQDVYLRARPGSVVQRRVWAN